MTGEFDSITVDSRGRGFLRDGEPWFYLADTCWSAATRPTAAEWEHYLDYRVNQGFTAVQVNILPQWDRSRDLTESGGIDFETLNYDYFDRLRRRLEGLVARGLVPALVLLWANYVPGTWASERMPDHVIPEAHLGTYLRVAIETTRSFHPIYIIGGDTDLESPRAIATYQQALRSSKELAPDAITVIHLRGDYARMPRELREMSELDCYGFQSGHGGDQSSAERLARTFFEMKPVRPAINLEPCYEGIRRVAGLRSFQREDLRFAAYRSLLEGAAAGVAYGAHGVWSWHRAGASFEGSGHWGEPPSWESALELEGAWDYAYLRWLWERYELWGADPIEGFPEGVSAAVTPDRRRVVVYLPSSARLEIPAAFGDFTWQRIELSTRRVSRPQFHRLQAGGGEGLGTDRSSIPASSGLLAPGSSIGDVLLIGSH
jgi:hypothetical protein